MWRETPCSSLLLWCTQSTLPSVLPALYRSLFITIFSQGGGQSVQGALLVYPNGGCGNTSCCLFAYLLVCFSQVGLELPSGGAGALLFSQCNVVGRSFVLARGVVCWSFVCSCWIFLPRVAPASQQNV
jgi:hypothetical protein